MRLLIGGPITDAEYREFFESCIHRAKEFGQFREWSCCAIDSSESDALQRVALERTDESVEAAWAAYDAHVTRMREYVAVWRAVKAGELPPRRSHSREYGPGSINQWPADITEAAEAWLGANRVNPGEIYRQEVLTEPR